MKGKINNWSFYSLGDHAIVFALAPKMDVLILQKIKHLNNYFIAQKMSGILDIIPSYHTLTIIYDINKFLATAETVNNQLLSFCNNIITDFENNFLAQKNIVSNIHQVPVCYDKCFGIDLENISLSNQISYDEIIQIHTSHKYDVYSIGFLPGFTYMGMVDEKIKIARHDKPRKEVLAGSVGIAGLQTGIYPTNSPGGWQIIGRTPWKIFDPHPNKLAKFKVGDRIQFYAIGKEDFDSLNEYN
jgi:inhibitor of KinA